MSRREREKEKMQSVDFSQDGRYAHMSNLPYKLSCLSPTLLLVQFL